MDKHSLIELEVQLKEIIRLEQVMKYNLLTPGDVISLKSLAFKSIPRAQFLYGVYMLLVERNKAEGCQYLEKCRKNCNPVFKAKIKKVYKLIKVIQKSAN